MTDELEDLISHFPRQEVGVETKVNLTVLDANKRGDRAEQKASVGLGLQAYQLLPVERVVSQLIAVSRFRC
jgi:hypothetical protein